MILAATLTLSVKVNDLWTGYSDFVRSMEIAPNQAKAGEAGGTAPGAEKAGAAAGTQVAATAELPRDPSRFTQSEIDLLQALSSRRDVLDQREDSLNQREVTLQAAEKRLQEKAASLEGMKTELMRLINQRNDAEDQRLRSLVRIYESMKPKEAAQILQRLDTDVAIGVIERMKDSKVAPVLASMDAERAQVITALLADRRTTGSPGPATPPASAAK